MRRFYPVMLVPIAIFGAIFSFARAQDTSQGTPIEITGVVSQISTNTLVVAGLNVDVSGVALGVNITVGTTVRITGVALPNNVVVAHSVIVVVVAMPTPEVTAEPTLSLTPSVTPGATATPTSNVVIIVEGPVINVINNIITIYNFDIEVEPQHPILNLIEIGDFIHVEGTFGNTGVMVATTVSNVSSSTTVNEGTVSLEGPVESIIGSTIVVNGVSAQLDPNDPLLQSLQVGNFVSLQGDFQGSGSTIILVVINIVIINNVVVEGNPYCWWHEPGMGMGMGHWHCDGMGMGGMGMGEDGMGGMGMGD